jgi:protein-tyrosine phosphatase
MVDEPLGGAVTASRGRLPGWRAAYNRASTRLYGPMRGLEGFSWIDGERVAIGSIPVGDAVERLPELGVTHVVNCRAPFQTRISQDLWAEREVFGEDRVMSAPMWDNGRRQPPRLWAPAARFAAQALDEDPDAGVLIHCQQGRRRSAMVAYAVLRLRGHDPAEAARLVLESRAPARLVPAYRASVEDWLASLERPL